ncbi:MAG: cation:dicarboxylase symporter family transporter [Gemmatimonadetes bacterium]|nr:dicarboxylate/amino acid:cation symporter [Gemmatimonadota bacterium]NNM03585.1 cation:dicarboxylase symporter family transporter [Gemmatimonadota bacterium]
MKSTPRRFTATMGFWSLVALVGGGILGFLGFQTGSPWVFQLAAAVQPAGTLWLNALQLTVLPLVVMQLLTAIAGNGDGASVAAVGKRTLVFVIVALLGLTGVGYLITAPFVGLLSVSPETVAAVRESVLVPASVQDAAASVPGSGADWPVSLIPTNIMDAAVKGDLIQILLVTIVFGLAVKKLPEEQRKPLAEIFRAGADAILIVIRWVLVATPVGVFATVMGLTLGAGSEAAGILGSFVVLYNGVTFLCILAFYPLASVLGRVGLARFARAALTPQIVAASTRSSIASLPAQVESGREELGFSSTTSGFVVPLLVSTFKLSTPIWGVTRILFLATIFGIDLTPGQFVAFTATFLLLGQTVLGVPNGGAAFRTLPAFVAVGIPVEGLVLLHAVRDLNDYASTVANTTGQFAAATILSRGDRLSSAAEPATVP